MLYTILTLLLVNTAQAEILQFKLTAAQPNPSTEAVGSNFQRSMVKKIKITSKADLSPDIADLNLGMPLGETGAQFWFRPPPTAVDSSAGFRANTRGTWLLSQP